MATTGRDIQSVVSFVKSISVAWQKGVESIIETGSLLIQAKKKLPHGKFTRMIEEKLPFGERTARMLMTVAKHPILSKRKYTSVLPPSWYTLYELSRISEDESEELIKTGEITPELTQAEARELRRTDDESTEEEDEDEGEEEEEDEGEEEEEEEEEDKDEEDKAKPISATKAIATVAVQIKDTLSKDSKLYGKLVGIEQVFGDRDAILPDKKLLDNLVLQLHKLADRAEKQSKSLKTKLKAREANLRVVN